MKNLTSRRGFVKNAAAGIGMLAMPSLLSAQTDPGKLVKIICIGGHPDDPESGCGGTLAKFAAAGHGVTIIYLTRGEAGIPGNLMQKQLRLEAKNLWRPVKYFKPNLFLQDKLMVIPS